MSSLSVTAEPLIVHPHSNADALELAQVGLYRAVVPKGRYKTGDYAIYIPEQALLPEALIEELGLGKLLAGSKHNRVKAIRLRGELSQGIVCHPSSVRADLALAHANGTDFGPFLGISKWVPEVPVHMAGRAIPAPDLLRWIEIENLKRYPDVFEPGERVLVSEKVHGTACLLTYVAATDEVYVSSKGLGETLLGLADEPENLYWKAVRGHSVIEFARYCAEVFGAQVVGVYGEVYGAGVQDLGYGASAKTEEPPGYAVFDVKLASVSGTRWLSHVVLRAMVEVLSDDEEYWSLAMVPELYDGPYDQELILKLASGSEEITGRSLHIREGVVVRPRVERYSDVLGGRAIAKVVSAEYLTRKGGTEYQ